MEEIKQLLQSPSLKEALEHHSITWLFLPKQAPWYSGFWERLVGLTKQALRKMLGRAFITLPVLHTTVVETEAVLNDRPLTYISSDDSDVELPTPAHLICGWRITSLPHSHDNNMDDLHYLDGTALRKGLDNHSRILWHIQS